MIAPGSRHRRHRSVRGLGEAIAIAAADAGASLVGVDIDHAPDERIVMRTVDVTRRTAGGTSRRGCDGARGVSRPRQQRRRHDAQPAGRDVSLADWNRTLAINVTGPMLAMQTLVDFMPPGSSIVNMGSIAALTGHFAIPTARASGPCRGLSRAASLELGPRGRPRQRGDARPHSDGDDCRRPARGVRRAGRQRAARSAGEPADVASTVRFLLGPESAYLTGQELAVDGGQTAHGGMKLLSDAVRSATSAPVGAIQLCTASGRGQVTP